jgi:hypothetical protein
MPTEFGAKETDQLNMVLVKDKGSNLTLCMSVVPKSLTCVRN